MSTLRAWADVANSTRPNLARPPASITLTDNVGILKIIRPAMKMVPLFGSVLEGAVETIQKICEHADLVRENKQALVDVTNHATLTLATIGDALQTMNYSERVRMSASIHALNMSLQAVLTKAEHLGGTRKRDRLMAVLRPHSLGKEIAELQTCLDDAEQQFHLSAQMISCKRDSLMSLLPEASVRIEVGFRLGPLRFDSSSRFSTSSSTLDDLPAHEVGALSKGMGTVRRSWV